MQEYRLLMTRPLFPVECENWENGERILLPEQFNNLVFFDPLFLFESNGYTKVYYNYSDPRQVTTPLLKYLIKNSDWLDGKLTEYYQDFEQIENMMKTKNQDALVLFNLMNKVFPMVSIASAFGGDYEIAPDNLMQRFIKARITSEILHPATYYLESLIQAEFASKYNQWILPSEYFTNHIPGDDVLEQRSRGCIYHLGRVHIDVKDYLARMDINLINPEAKAKDNKITGNIASPGVASGPVKIVFTLSDVTKVQDGDILVTPMTIPEFLPAMRKAAAFVTDEGGITCHAAIVAREIGKPCIIGTKIATKVLKDGDIVEVDADSGIVKKS